MIAEMPDTIEMPILEPIASRRSRRAFAPETVSQDQIDTLFEAARWAPSSVNEQPWRYVYATKGQLLWETIFEALNDGNKVWAKEAQLFIVSMAKKAFSRNGRPNPTALYDLGGANAFLSLQAASMGLNVHQMGGYDRDTLRMSLNIPEELELGVVMAIGFPGDAALLPEPLRTRELSPRVRMTRSEFVMNQPF
ncbi:MAG: nitroreductase family protein [Cyclobacteriaceae bacterium]|nr:nitroreductase family protein [Cyclobacteriaceae bacterium]